ncbi:hypothetical protein [Streptomyces celluloflavus]|uniref:hypothetical protein n=1 Tax=Streptomyces celluloflavus TaxID=58344 RepID=UPI0036A780E6
MNTPYTAGDDARTPTDTIRDIALTLWDTPTHVVWHDEQPLSLRSIHAVRRSTAGYTPLAVSPHAPADGRRLTLARLLTNLLDEDLGSPALASETGGWYRLNLRPVPGLTEDAADTAYEASAPFCA